MWRRSGIFLRNATSTVCYRPKPQLPVRSFRGSYVDYGYWNRAKLAAAAAFSSDTGGRTESGMDGCTFSSEEARKLMRLVNVEELKMKLGIEKKEIISYTELLEACEKIGVANSRDEAAAFASVLEKAGVILLFRDKVHLHPHKVLNAVRRSIIPLIPPSEEEEETTRDELQKLEEKKEEIDKVAHKQVRYILWMGLGLGVVQVGLFFRLTFWEYSWDVMEPIAFFTTATGILIGYGYFLFTSRDPTYQDFMQRLFLSRQRKLIKKHSFDVNRLIHLQKNCNRHHHHPLSSSKPHRP